VVKGAGLYEPIEFLKDYYYIDAFAHYNWITFSGLVFSLTSSILLSFLWIWFNYMSEGNHNTFDEELTKTLFGSTPKKMHSNEKRKVMKYLL
jgi:hypothetical protein